MIDIATTETLAAPDFLRAALATLQESRRGEAPFVQDLRRRAMASFRELGFPTRKIEAWRFTNTRPIADTPWSLADPPASPPDIAPWSIGAEHALVLVDGMLRPELSSLEGLPEGVTLCGLADALERTPELVDDHLGRHASFDDHSFIALNTGLFRDGALLLLSPNAVLEAPVHLLHVATARRNPAMLAPRFLIVAGRASQATVVEHFVGHGGGSLVCPVTEVVVEDGAVIEHHKLQEEAPGDNHVAALQVRIGRNGAFSSHSISIDGSLVRNDIGATLAGEGASCTLNGLYLTDGRQHVDNQIRVRHAAPHCTSHQLYKGILGGSSRTVFTGRIVVDRGAQKTDARQSNRNLLLSEGALARSNPQLEIFADDVRCTHGSTVGRLDEDAVFYLRSRGLTRAAAESLLTYAFASEVVGRIKVEPLRRRLDGVLFDRLPHGEIIREAV